MKVVAPELALKPKVGTLPMRYSITEHCTLPIFDNMLLAIMLLTD